MIPYSKERQLRFLQSLTVGSQSRQLTRMILSLAESVKESQELYDYKEQERLRRNPDIPIPRRVVRELP